MKRRDKQIARKRQLPWQALQPARQIPLSAERLASLRAAALEHGADPNVVLAEARTAQEIWQNDLYTVIVRRADPGGWVAVLSVRRNDRGPDVPWRHLQRIKTELAGAEAEAIELFPAESRLMDTANQRWLWCFEPGVKLPFGFDQGRVVGGPEEAAAVGARQEALDE